MCLFFLIYTLNYRCCVPMLIPCSALRSWVIMFKEMEADRERWREKMRELMQSDDGGKKRKNRAHTHRWQWKENVINNHSGKCFTRFSSLHSEWECVHSSLLF